MPFPCRHGFIRAIVGAVSLSRFQTVGVSFMKPFVGEAFQPRSTIKNCVLYGEFFFGVKGVDNINALNHVHWFLHFFKKEP